MQQRRVGPPDALAQPRPGPPPEAPGRTPRRRQRRARAWNPSAAPAAVADSAVAPVRGAQAGGDLPGGADGPAGRRVVVDLPAVARPGALLRHALRGQHQAVLVSSGESIACSPRRRCSKGLQAAPPATPQLLYLCVLAVAPRASSP
jgi:hypothetical protein